MNKGGTCETASENQSVWNSPDLTIYDFGTTVTHALVSPGHGDSSTELLNGLAAQSLYVRYPNEFQSQHIKNYRSRVATAYERLFCQSAPSSRTPNDEVSAEDFELCRALTRHPASHVNKHLIPSEALKKVTDFIQKTGEPDEAETVSVWLLTQWLKQSRPPLVPTERVSTLQTVQVGS